MKIIDPHIHLFDLRNGQYHWLKAENPPHWPDKKIIAKNFAERDLLLAPPLELVGFVHIEAGFDNQQAWREIAWLEDTCETPFRSIAMLDITLPVRIFSQQLETLTRYQSVAGIRYILDDDAITILSNKNSRHNLAALAVKKLSFELQLSIEDTQVVESLIEIISATSGLLYCINHAGWPPQNDNSKTNWLQNLKRLAKFNNVFIKCSGYEMINRHYSHDWSDEIISRCIDSFGITRVMLASNFPLCLWHASYQDTWFNNNLLKKVNERRLSADDFNQLCYQNAYKFYKFNSLNVVM